METALVIHPEGIVRRQIQEVLQSIGLASKSVQNASAGLALARRDPPDVILCAHRGEEGEGHEIARLFREKIEQCRQALFLMISNQRSRWKSHLQPGIDGFLRLPLDERVLVTVVRAYLARRPEEQAAAVPAPSIAPEPATLARRLVSMAEKCWKNNALSGGTAPLRGHRAPDRAFVHAGQVDFHAREMARFHGREADLQCHVEGGFLPVSPDELASIVGELVENACRFSEPGSPIKVFEVRGEGCVELCVRDYGCIPGSEAMRQSTGQGLGLGLTLAKILVESRQGHFHLHTFPRAGALVRIELPLWAPHQEALAA